MFDFISYSRDSGFEIFKILPPVDGRTSSNSNRETLTPDMASERRAITDHEASSGKEHRPLHRTGT